MVAQPIRVFFLLNKPGISKSVSFFRDGLFLNKGENMAKYHPAHKKAQSKLNLAKPAVTMAVTASLALSPVLQTAAFAESGTDANDDVKAEQKQASKEEIAAAKADVEKAQKAYDEAKANVEKAQKAYDEAKAAESEAKAGDQEAKKALKDAAAAEMEAAPAEAAPAEEAPAAE